MIRAGRLRRSVLGVALVLSVAPLYVAAVKVQAAYHSFTAQYLDRGPQPALPPDLSRLELAEFKPLPRYAGIPVLVYHGINDDNDGYSVSRQTFSDQMAMLHRAGFHTISIEQYRRYMFDRPVRLPSRPILVTMDDGRLDSFRGADSVLERYGFRATMFVVAGFPASRFYLQWSEIAAMSRSGRWDIQEHAGRQHYTVPYRRGSDVKAPAYAVRELEGGGSLESFLAYRNRVTSDLLWGREELVKHVPGFRPLAFAVPYADFGQDTTNDRRIAPFLDRFLVDHFGLVFVESNDPSYTSALESRGAIGRIEIHTRTSALALYRRLKSLDPAYSASGRESMYASVNEGTMAQANALLRNVWPERGYPPLALPWPLTWRETEDDPHDDAYWRFQFYSLQPTSNLLWAYETTRDHRYLARLLAILRSYVAYDRVRPYDRLTFDNAHQAAYRAMVLVNVQKRLSADRVLPSKLNRSLLRSIRKLGAALARSDRDHWEWWVNHGFTEAAALLLVADNYYHEFPEAWRWRDVALQRLLFMLRTNIDRDGVDIENSPYYHYYVLELVSQIARWAEANDEPAIARAYGRAERKMLVYAADIVQPDGRLPSLGASGPSLVPAMDPTVYEPLEPLDPHFRFVWTQGLLGTPPPTGAKVFAGSGLVVMRSPSPSRLERERQTFVTFDSGKYRTDHSDLDAESITLYADGRELLPDSGLYTYLPGAARRYFHGTVAHNTVVVDGRDQRAGNASVLAAGRLPNGGSFAVGDNALNPGVDHRRTVVLLRPGLVLVSDRLVSSRPHAYAQTWHVLPGARLRSAGPGGASVEDAGGRTLLAIRQAQPVGIRLSSLEGRRNPLAGWFSASYGQKTPNLQLSFTRRGRNAQFVTLLDALPGGATVTSSGSRVHVCARGRGYSISLRTVVKHQEPSVDVSEHGC
jgi:peptidoglycan/xylan/chitin deacetylase (PgdA/CDA1 family)